MAQGVVAGIFFGDRRNKGFDEVVLDVAIGEIVGVVVGVGAEAGAERRLRVTCVGNRGNNAFVDEGGVIKAFLSGESQFFLESLGWKIGRGADGSEVGNNPENASGLHAGLHFRGFGLGRIDDGGIPGRMGAGVGSF